ncbi:hypothetical protein ACFZBM_31360 [Streptomyces lavendulae]|uniref:Uncharacterized protein n=1 Tax=Streptomyces lavendulae subsp. lavendulae TaxID=58340 RepID=A0A2K8PQQ0_STRLA|nr:hypothetical protein [Streptomyces lavendulae]ATZ29054.1 hypothetical protein SLAV_36445 [Streptomyces lavendulae subsp. lavendulae]QUQ58875.1 hypothetical protein SLLC_34620 [Streptomyces lavendulae subsp. lavendulae]
MSDDVLSIIPSDPQWQPDRDVVDRVIALVEDLAPGVVDGVDVEIDATWHDVVTAVDCGDNLERIGCPLCQAAIDTEWWGDLLEAHCDDGFTTLAIEVPCCGGSTTLDVLDYDWPCGFARFEIAIWNPERLWFGEGELTALADLLGHPVKQIRAHV